MLNQDNVTVANCAFNGNNRSLSINSQGNVHVQGCNFTQNTMAVEWLEGKARITIVNCEIRQNVNSMIGSYCLEILISKCRFFQTSNAIQLLKNRFVCDRAYVTVQDCLFEMNDRSIVLDTEKIRVIRIHDNIFRNEISGNAISITNLKGHIFVEHNTFVDLSHGAVSIQDPGLGEHILVIRGNMFRRVRGVPLRLGITKGNIMIVENNMFLTNNATHETAGIYLLTDSSYGVYNVTGIIRLNHFRENSGTNMIEVFEDESYHSFHGKLDFNANVFHNNYASQGTFVTNSALCNVNYNTFTDNLSQHEFLVTFRGDESVSAQYNWWGAADNDHVTGRIRDQSDDPELGRALYKPFLTKLDMPCDEVANCSGHGWCVRPNTCVCQSGWTGSECSHVSCADICNCSGHGACVGPNVCQCNDGWLAPNCAQASCPQRNNCSGHGSCVGPNRYVGDTTIFASCIGPNRYVCDTAISASCI